MKQALLFLATFTSVTLSMMSNATRIPGNSTVYQLEVSVRYSPRYWEYFVLRGIFSDVKDAFELAVEEGSTAARTSWVVMRSPPKDDGDIENKITITEYFMTNQAVVGVGRRWAYDERYGILRIRVGSFKAAWVGR